MTRVVNHDRLDIFKITASDLELGMPFILQ
jgi:hypothetical protein